MSRAESAIYLTFDDGPSISTPKILDILDRYEVKATFFVIFYDRDGEDLIKREYASGHTVAVHGCSHTYSEIYSSADACMENFRIVREQLYHTIGERPVFLRFPGGSSNTVSRHYCKGVMTELTQRVLREGFRYFDWNVDSGDSGEAKTAEEVYGNVTSQIRPGRSNFVLMHDFAKNDKTVEALGRIIAYGKENGYLFRRITEKTPLCVHKVYN
ncbi:MAG: polysaccharide deacetylase family protein [Eubacteriales bacterium]|nr:polysaccharide deacetylase family protein [Eubacteriales bacterium]